MELKIYTCTMESQTLSDAPIAACIGYFDGLHRGHMELVSATLKKAKELNAESAMITFEPDPWVVVKQVQDVQHLSTMKQRQKLAEAAGIEHFIILDFTKEMSRLSEAEFVQLIQKNFNLKAMICGFDFHYGLMGQGNAQTLSHHGFDVVCVGSVNDEKGKISSTRICECIDEGKIEEANELLGYPYTIVGEVIHGNAKGTGIGFPTANILSIKEFLIPQRGVYAGKVKVDDKWHTAMINIGYNPTFNKRRLLSIEAHLLNFNENIYGKEVEVQFCVQLRSERKFDSVEALIHQLQKDVKATQEYFHE